MSGSITYMTSFSPPRTQTRSGSPSITQAEAERAAAACNCSLCRERATPKESPTA